MISRRYGEQSRVAFWPPMKKITLLGYIFLALGTLPLFFANSLHQLGSYDGVNLEAIVDFVAGWMLTFAGISLLLFCIAFLVDRYTPERIAIRQMLRYRLFSKAGGNPLGLKNESAIPSLNVKDDGEGRYRVIIDTTACSADTLVKLPKIISSGLIDNYAGWAVVAVEEDPASSYVSYIIEDVTRSRKIVATHLEDIYGDCLSVIIIQKGFALDLTKSGSILICGKTRSGKTTAVECILMQVLVHGPDRFGSKVLILDPKGAELSRLPYTLSRMKMVALAVCYKRFENSKPHAAHVRRCWMIYLSGTADPFTGGMLGCIRACSSSMSGSLFRPLCRRERQRMIPTTHYSTCRMWSKSSLPWALLLVAM